MMDYVTLAAVIAIIVCFVALSLWRRRLDEKQYGKVGSAQPRFTRPEARKPQNIPFDRDSLPLRHNTSSDSVDWAAVQDERVAQHLPNRKIEAIKAYREITGVGLKEAKDAVEYAIANPHKVGKGFNALAASMSDAGIRDLLDAGKFEEAVDAYRTFTGVDTFTARNAVETLQRELTQSEMGSNSAADEQIRQALRDGKKIKAVKLYRQFYNVGLKEAKDAVDAMEREI